MPLNRTPRSSEPGHLAPEIPFRISGNVKEKFNQKYPDIPRHFESRIDKRLNYQAQKVTILRSPDHTDGSKMFKCFVPLEEEFLVFGFRRDNDQTAFFVTFLAFANQLPSTTQENLETEITLLFLGVRGRVPENEAFYELFDRLAALPVQRSRDHFDVKKEIKIWSKYLEVQEAIIKDKSVLLRVENGQKKQRGKRGTEIEYDLDLSEYATELQKELRDRLQPEIVNDFHFPDKDKDQDKDSYIEMRGHITPDEEWMERLVDAVNWHFFRLGSQSQSLRPLVKATFEFIHMDTAQQMAELAEVENQLGKAGLAVKRNENQFSFAGWNGWRHFQKVVPPKHPTLSVASSSRVFFSAKHLLEDEDCQREACREALQQSTSENHILKRQIDSPGHISLVSEKGLQPTQLPYLAPFDLDEVSLQIHVPEETDQPSLPKRVRFKNGVLHFNASSLQKIQADIQNVVQENPDLELPGWEQVEVRWKFRLGYFAQEKSLRKALASTVRDQAKGQLNWPNGQFPAATEAACENTFRQLQSKHPDFSFEVKRLDVPVDFRVNNLKFRKSVLTSVKENLKNAFGDKLIKAIAAPQSRTLAIEVEISPATDAKEALLMLARMNPSQLRLKEQDTLEITRIDLHWDPRNFEGWLSGRWQDLRNRQMRFLTLTEKEEYDKEIAGKSSNYREREPIGKLTRLHQGKLRLLLEDEDTSVREVEKGYLMPIFIGDRAQLQRLKTAIRTVQYPKPGQPINPNLGNFIFDPSFARPIHLEKDIRSDHYWQLKHELNQKQLNDKQREAVWKAIQSTDLVMIQGPPGTGKTTVIAEIIWQVLQEGPDSRILISSQAHLAVDNALHRLYQKNLIRPLRIASSKYASKAVEPEGQKYIEEIILNWTRSAPGSKQESEASPNAIETWIQRIDSKILAKDSIEKWQQKWKKVLQKPNPDVKEFFAGVYLDNVNIVAATCLECGRRDFKEKYEEGFDYVIVDEASKATPPELLIPLNLGRKIIIIGDHRQLPPMIEERQLEEFLEESGQPKLAEEIQSYKVSQFEKLFLNSDDSIRVSLTTQYRMHEQIMQVINPFYQEEGGLECGILKTIDEPNLNHPGSRWHGISVDPIITPNTHVVWVDVQEPELFHQPSFSNPGEVRVIRALLDRLAADPGFQRFQQHWESPEDREIGLVSFYGKQIQALKDLVEEFKPRIPIRLRTVDKFQGMERNIMIVSTVRSHLQTKKGSSNSTPKPNRSIGFAKDYRRINVAFSRARRLLIIVGNEAHFSQNNEFYKNIKTVIARMGARVDASQIL